MTHKLFLAIAFVLTSLTLFCCKKEKTDEIFCGFVDTQNFNETGPLIDNFLSDLKNGTPEEHLNALRDWLDDKSCVDSVSIFCNSCIFTFPAQSELRVGFISNGQKINRTLDILMSEKLKFRSYHE